MTGRTTESVGAPVIGRHPANHITSNHPVHTHTHTHVGVSLFAFRNFDIVFLGFDHLTAIVMQSHMICFVNEIGSMTIDL